jgi:glycosyltransferase involved in cell wall biosynthesis
MQNKAVPVTTITLSAVSLAIWLYLTFARGMFFRLSPFDDDQAKHLPPPSWPRVIAIVPARNEAETIGQTVAALLGQDYLGQFSVIVVDDHSEDDTVEVAQQSAAENGESRIQIQRSSPLPPGWTGKLWALNEGVKRTASPPELSARAKRSTPSEGICFPPLEGAREAAASNLSYFWFTDADVVHAPDTLRRLVSRAEQNKLDLTSLMVLLQARTLPERALIPAFLYFFLKLYPPRWIADAQASTAGAAGGCVLLRREALERIGGLVAIRSEVIDDCALARAVKRSGGPLWMGLTRTSRSLRAYKTFADVRDMIARTAFTQLRYSSLLLFGTLAGLFFTYIAPATAFITHQAAAQLFAIAAWLLMWLTFLPTLRFYRLSPLWAPLLPFAALFYAYATWLSAVRYWLNRGAQWKGRAQAPRQA